MEEVGNGIYVGRLWYTYPINGYASPDYTSTIRGDSFIIENGEITGALTPNSMLVMDSFERFLNGITGIGREQKTMLSWGEETAVISPEISLGALRLKSISKGIY